VGRNQFNPKRPVTVEANIFDFDRDLYDQPVAVYPTAFVRENRRFDSADALARQIDQDKQQVLRISQKENVSWQ
jgi:riboflavin kinase/FMN adenylyltransferase